MQPHPMPEFGSYSLLLSLALCAYCLVMGGIALWQSKSGHGGRLGETARRAGIGSFVALSGAAFALVWASFTNDYSVSYILHHTNRDLNTAYKFSALWSGQEGSLLLWAWLLSAYGFVLRMRHKVDVRLSAYASTILAGVQVFFLLLLNFAAPPFAIQPGPVAQDGFGLNPLLQYPEMVIHPPMLYLGYVGFSVPFAFALGALMMRYPGEKWIHITRRWTMVTWLFLTCGIFLGAHWAYSVLGWGGYWGWDPVENASLMPWLTGKARDDEELECVAYLLDVSADDSGNTADAVWNCEFCPCIRAVFDRKLVLWVHSRGVFGLPVYVLQAERPSEDGKQAGVRSEP